MRPINATLFVSSFTGTGTIGEYTFSGAAFDNQSDATGNGSLDVTVGCKIYVQPTDGNTGAPISGAVHRYKLTAVSYPDSNSLSGTMLWDEPSAEADSPTNGTYAMLAQATPNHGLSLVPSTSIYANLPSGSDIQAIMLDSRDVTDNIGLTSSTGTGVIQSTIEVTGYTTNATPLVLGPSQPLAIPNQGTASFKTTVVGHRVGAANQRCVFTIEGVVYMDDNLNTVALIGNNLTTILARTNASWYAQAIANAATGALDIQVTGSATSLNWSATTTLTIFTA